MILRYYCFRCGVIQCYVIQPIEKECMKDLALKKMEDLILVDITTDISLKSNRKKDVITASSIALIDMIHVAHPKFGTLHACIQNWTLFANWSIARMVGFFVVEPVHPG